MKSVLIGLYRKSGIISNIIKFFSRGNYSHVAIQVNGVVYESKEFHSVRKLTDWCINTATVDIYEILITEEQEKELIIFLEKQLGKPYDYMMVLGFLFFTTREKRKSRRRWFCSEFVFAALEKIGIKLFNNIEPWKISPVMLSYSPLLKFKYQINKSK